MDIMRGIDALHLAYLFACRGILRYLLAGEGIEIDREAVRTMMKRMDIQAIHRRPNTSKPAREHRNYPYLLRALPVDRANHLRNALLTVAKLDTLVINGGPSFLLGAEWSADRVREGKFSVYGLSPDGLRQRRKMSRWIGSIIDHEN